MEIKKVKLGGIVRSTSSIPCEYLFKISTDNQNECKKIKSYMHWHLKAYGYEVEDKEAYYG